MQCGKDHHGFREGIKDNAQHDAGTLRDMHGASSQEYRDSGVSRHLHQDRRPPTARRMLRL